MPRPNTAEVLSGLQLYAVGEESAIRAKDLAVRLGLANKVVSNALNWLVVEGKHPNVRRARQIDRQWCKYWWADK